MSPPRHLAPLALAALSWVVLQRLNRTKGWFRPGEVIFWDAVVGVLFSGVVAVVSSGICSKG